MAFENLPGIKTNKIDGNLTIKEINSSPSVCVIGTAGRGTSDDLVQVLSPTEAVKTFGYDGTCTRGVFEAYGWGAKNFRVWRYGGTACQYSGIGVAGSGIDSGIVITTIQRDATAADEWTLHWDDTSKELYVWDKAGTLIYKRDFDSESTASIDNGRISVSGTYGAGGADIGTLAAPDDFEDPTNPLLQMYTAGTDGTENGGPSYMQKYEELYKIYKLLENDPIDYIVPMDVYLDVPNLADSATAFQQADGNLWTALTSTSYPTARATHDALGLLYVQEYNGEYYFWWDIDDDGVAEIYPSVGLSSSTTNADGTTLEATDFREVNFAYQLAHFCFTQSMYTHECFGQIGVLPPAGLSKSNIISWIGKEPTFSLDDNRQRYVASATDNGSGLLGNKFMAGKDGYRSGIAYGGFILTADGFPSQAASVEQYDDNDHLIDIGKYIDIVAGWCVLNTPWDTTGNGYIGNMAAAYAGFDSGLKTGEAATNQSCTKARLPFPVNKTKLDSLAKMRYVMVGKRSKGIVWVDAPTAARPDSDYQRRHTMRTVKKVVNDIRTISDPFLGKSGSALKRAALKTQIDGVISKYVNAGLQGGFCEVNATVEQQIRGEGTVELTLVPEFEWRKIVINLSLAPTL